MDRISKLTHRRFVLGQQGLWPGRRFKGLSGTTAAIRQMGSLQLDPLNIVARSQDIALYGRVLGYRPDYLYKAAYKQRRFFDYGRGLFMYPMQELPYWRVVMQRAIGNARMRAFREAHPHAMDDALEAVRANGPLGNRDLNGERLRYWSYRGRKDSALALYYLWLLGEVMITHRRGFDRVYDLSERVVPPEFQSIAPVKEAEDFFARKVVAGQNLMREKRFHAGWKESIERLVSAEEAEHKLEELLDAKVLTRLQLEGSKETWIALSESVPALEALESGRIPKQWKPSGRTTEEEVTLLAPLEMASARGRAKQLFDFDYIWEVYKPLEQRRWGYYTLPVLYGDDLVARLDPKLDRKTGTLHVLGFWLEEDTIPDQAFAAALGRGLTTLAHMAGAQKVALGTIKPAALRREVRKILASDGL
ncbi:MAG: DNA glycosylase AlkZ-like family protein [Bacteroidota bacterium]